MTNKEIKTLIKAMKFVRRELKTGVEEGMGDVNELNPNKEQREALDKYLHQFNPCPGIWWTPYETGKRIKWLTLQIKSLKLLRKTH